MIRAAIYFALTLAAWAATAGPAAAMTLDDCVKTALEKNGGAIMAAKEREKAELAKTEALGRALPNLDVSGSYLRNITNPEVDFLGQKFKLMPDSTYQAQASISQYLYSGAISAGYSASKRYVEAAAGMETAWRRTLAAQVKTGFYAVLFAREVIKAENAAIAQLSALLADAKNRLSAGMGTSFDVMRLETRLAEEIPRLMEAENAHTKAKLDLLNLMGMDPMGPAAFEGTLEREGQPGAIPSEEEAARLALERRPELAAARARVEAARHIADAVKSEMYPTVRAFANYKVANSIGITDADKLFDQWNAGVSVEMNIMDGRERSSRVSQRNTDAAIERIRLDDLERSIKIEALTARGELARAMELYKSQEKSAHTAQEAYRIATVSHQEGMLTQLELLDAQMALTRAGINRLRSLFEYAAAEARFARAIGVVEDK